MHADLWYEGLEVEEFKLLLEEKILTKIYPSPDAQAIKVQSRRPTKPALQHVQRFELHAQPMKGENESNINAFDGRTQVLTTAKWPNSVHGVLVFKHNNITTWGTGILIGPHVVLTAGHNLYNYKRKEYVEVQSMQYLPGMHGQILPFGVVEVEKAFVSPNYIKNETEDYGILILKEPIGEMTGYFGLACLEPEEIQKKTINVTGYPGDKVAEKPNIYEMWGMQGTAAHIDRARGQINYLIDTSTGQSGSGVWYQEEEDYYVCGVHVSGTKFVNTATLLTRTIYQQIYTWLQEQASFKELFFKLRDKKELKLQKNLRSGCVSLLMKYNLDDLTCLSLSSHLLREEAVKELAQNTSWTNLSKLYLHKNIINAEGIKELAQNASWVNLSDLYLSHNKINLEGAKALAQNTSWKNLSKLNLSQNLINAKGAQELAQNTSWTNLSVLDLSFNNLGPEGAKALAQNTSWTSLSVLDLSFNNLGPEGAKALAQNTSWINLSDLSLEDNMVNAEGAKELAQNNSWVNLSHLDLRWNNIGEEGAKALARNISWINLSRLDISNNAIDAEGELLLKNNKFWKKDIIIQAD